MFGIKEKWSGDTHRLKIYFHKNVNEGAMREARDKTLAPRLLLPSIQVNIRAGRFPPAQANGVRYLTIPVKIGEGAEGV